MGSAISLLCSVTLIGIVNASCIPSNDGAKHIDQNEEKRYCSQFTLRSQCTQALTNDRCDWKEGGNNDGNNGAVITGNQGNNNNHNNNNHMISGISGGGAVITGGQKSSAEYVANARYNFMGYADHTIHKDFIANVKKNTMSIDVSLEMTYSTTIAIQVLHALFFEYFEGAEARNDWEQACKDQIKYITANINPVNIPDIEGMVNERTGKNFNIKQDLDLKSFVDEFDKISWYILAVGSFGRSELLPCSDLDVAYFAIGEGFVNNNLKKEYKGAGYELTRLLRMKMNGAAIKFLKRMRDNIQNKLRDQTTFNFNKYFSSKAWELDPSVPVSFGDSVVSLTQNAHEAIILKKQEVSFSEIAFFGDAQVIYETIYTPPPKLKNEQNGKKQNNDNNAPNQLIAINKPDPKIIKPDPSGKTFKEIQKIWIDTVPEDQLLRLWGLKYKKWMRLPGKDQKTYSASMEIKSLDLKKAHQIAKDAMPKNYFIRGYTLLTYYTYLIAYKHRNAPWQDRGIYLTTTVERLHKLAEWGYMVPELAYWSCYYFHLMSQYNLHANIIEPKDKNDNYKWDHNKGISYLKQRAIVDNILSVKKRPVASLHEFGKAITEIKDKLEKEKSPIAKTNTLEIASVKMENDKINADHIDQDILMNIISQDNQLNSKSKFKRSQSMHNVVGNNDISNNNHVKTGSVGSPLELQSSQSNHKSPNNVDPSNNNNVSPNKGDTSTNNKANSNSEHQRTHSTDVDNIDNIVNQKAYSDYANIMDEFSSDYYKLNNQQQLQNQQQLRNQQKSDNSGNNGLQTELIVFGIIELFGIFIIICCLFICLSGFLAYYTGYTRNKNKSSHVHLDEVDVDDNGSNYQFL